MNLCDVSVVIPCYNSSHTILRSLDSIERQVHLPREVFVVDDGSDLPIEPVIKKWNLRKKIQVNVLAQPNRGPAAARNLGIVHAQCRYIAFLDADDVWLPQKLLIQYQAMDANGLTICGHGYSFNAYTTPGGRAASKAGDQSLRMLSKWNFAFGNPLFTPTVMVSKSAFQGFDERFRRVDDYKAWIENFRSGQCGYINAILAAGFKPPIGHSGLTGSISLMHESYLQVLKALFDDKKISPAFYRTALLTEFLKLPIRRFRARQTGGQS